MPTVYAAMRHGLLVVTGPPDDPEAVERFADHDLECVAASPDAPERVFCGTFDAGLWRSEDAGASWHPVGEGVLEDAVMSLAVNPGDSDEIWAGTEPSRVFRSTDAGDTWTERPGLTDLPSASGWSFPPRPHTHHVRWIEVDPANPDHLYVGVEAGALVQTRDRGASWEDRTPGSRRDNHSLTTHPDAPGRAWAAAGDGYAETRDGGETWETHHDGLGHRYCWSVAVDPGDPDTVLVSAASGPRSAHTAGSAESHLYRKRGDDPWERLDDRGIPTGDGVLRAVLAAGDDPGECYAVNNRGLYRTDDAGDSWTTYDFDWPTRFESQTSRGLAVVHE